MSVFSTEKFFQKDLSEEQGRKRGQWLGRLLLSGKISLPDLWEAIKDIRLNPYGIGVKRGLNGDPEQEES